MRSRSSECCGSTACGAPASWTERRPPTPALGPSLALAGGAVARGVVVGRCVLVTPIELRIRDSRERVTIERRPGRQRDGQPEVHPGLALAPELLQALPERELRVVRGRVDLEQRLERLACPVVLPGVEVRPPERLEDRRLARLHPHRPLEHDRGLRVVPPLQETLPAL